VYTSINGWGRDLNLHISGGTHTDV
jgi:hypothetical protein